MSTSSNIDQLQLIKEALKLHLHINATTFAQLEGEFVAVKPGFSTTGPVICMVVAILAILSLQPIFVMIGIIAVLAILNDQFGKGDYDYRRAEVLARFISEWVYDTQFNNLQTELSELPLSSLREVRWRARFTIAFKTPKLIHCSFYCSSPSIKKFGKTDFSMLSRPRSTEYLKSSIDLDNAEEISPGVFINYDSIDVDIKCDFRIIRTCMTVKEIGWIFQKIIDLYPAISIDNISIKQFSSTKSFVFKKNYLDSGTIHYMSSKRRTNKRPVLTLDTLRSSSTAQRTTKSFNDQQNAFIATAPLSNSQSKPLTGLHNKKLHPGVIRKTQILLSKILGKRKEVELYAMKVAASYERTQNRTPEDVSKQNLGFDILSSDAMHNYRRIEVKGLSAEGNIVLTQNEVVAARANQDSYFLYIVDNCSGNDQGHLFILRNPITRELKTQTTEYVISLEQQNMHAVTKQNLQ